MRYMIVVAAAALTPIGALAANATEPPETETAKSQGPLVLNQEQMDTITAGQRNVHVHPPAEVSTPADGLSLPGAAGNAVDATDTSALADHQ